MIALLQRDLILAIRAGGGFGLGMAFFLMVVVLVPLGIGPDMVILAKVSVGILWVGALLACVLSLDRIFSLDYDDGTLELLVTSPHPVRSCRSGKSILSLDNNRTTAGYNFTHFRFIPWIAGWRSKMVVCFSISWHTSALGNRRFWRRFNCWY